MNPFTRAIAKRTIDRRLAGFIRHWDGLEALVIRVYKNQGASQRDEREYTRLRAWLEKNYPRWRDALEAHWRSTRSGGQPTQEDPFAGLIATEQAGAFVGNWLAMQTLPAAREALNQFLVKRLEDEKTRL